MFFCRAWKVGNGGCLGVLFFCLNFLVLTPSFAQNMGTDSLPLLEWKLGSHVQFSHAGIGMGVGASVDFRHFRFYTGGRINFAKKYTPTKGPIGIEFSAAYFPILSENRVQSFAVATYQVDFSKSYCRTAACVRKMNTIHAYTIGYGMEIELGKGISINNSIQVGQYTERFYNGILQERYSTSGFNALVKLGVMVPVRR